MPHEIETMFSAVETPWHRLGNVTEGALNSAEAIKMIGERKVLGKVVLINK